MRIQLKERRGTQWYPVDISKLAGQSLATFMVSHDLDIVSAVYQEGDKPVMFIANNMEHLDRYKDTLCISAKDLLELVGTEVIPKIVITELGGNFLEVKTHDATRQMPLV